MGAHSKPDLDDPFEEAIDEALNSLPADLRAEVSNVAIVVEDEPPAWGRELLGLYRGVPRAARGSAFGSGGMLPAKVCIFRGPIARLAAGDAERLRRKVSDVLLQELAHYFAVK
ncbi:metallopeptidase family protein [Mycobacterium sp.]|uniref:metallopeptidase family protein n=1 Tax=Mycobacterium sp. TaxID=1785 RepID=UPI0031D18498